jgi:hypothetical protein
MKKHFGKQNATLPPRRAGGRGLLHRCLLAKPHLGQRRERRRRSRCLQTGTGESLRGGSTCTYLETKRPGSTVRRGEKRARGPRRGPRTKRIPEVHARKPHGSVKKSTPEIVHRTSRCRPFHRARGASLVTTPPSPRQTRVGRKGGSRRPSTEPRSLSTRTAALCPVHSREVV